VVVVIDAEDRRIVEKRLPNEITSALTLLEPYREQLAGVVVESTFNWYWLVDGLMEAGFTVKLARAAYYMLKDQEAFDAKRLFG
jgi:transposase